MYKRRLFAKYKKFFIVIILLKHSVRANFRLSLRGDRLFFSKLQTLINRFFLKILTTKYNCIYPSQALGDILLFLGYYKAFSEKNNNKKQDLIILTKKYYKQLFSIFDSSLKFITISGIKDKNNFNLNKKVNNLIEINSI